MKSVQKYTLFLSLIGLVVGGCTELSAEDASTWRGQVSQALGVSGGDVPVPAKTGPSGKLQIAWDGAYADLLAADALAACWSSQGPLAKATYASAPIDNDQLIFYLGGKMAAGLCVAQATNVPAADAFYGAWIATRNKKECNVDVATGDPDTVNLAVSRTTTADYELTTIANLGLTGTRAEAARQKAQGYLAYADLSLCMATRLNEQLDSQAVLFASQEEIYRLFAIIRERSLTAAMQYTLIAKAMAAVNNSGSWDIANGNLALMPLRKLRDTGSSALLTRLGNDYAASLKLLVEVTDRSMETYARHPDAQATFGKQIVGAAGATVATESGRTRALQSLYGPNAWPFGAVTTNMDDPGVGKILALARDAQALKLTFRAPVSGSTSSELDWEVNAQSLLSAIETRLRQLDCARRADTSATCLAVPSATNFTQYLLWREHAVTPDHARALIRALTETVVGQPNAVYAAEPTVWHFGQVGALAKRPLNPTIPLLGSHTQTGSGVGVGAGPTTVTIDPKFTTRPYRASELQATLRTDLTFFPPFLLDVRDSPDVAGFSFRTTSWAVPFWDLTAEPLRTFGPLAVLALAQETIPTLEGTGFYQGVLAALDVLDTAIGKRTAVVRPFRVYTSSTACATWRDNGVTPTSCTLQSFASPAKHEVALVTKGVELASAVAYGGIAGAGQAFAVTTDANSRGFNGITINVLNSLARAGLPSTTLGSFRQRRAAVVTGPAIFLASGTGSGSVYEPIVIPATSTLSTSYGVVVSFGGTLNQEAEKLWEFDARNWSKPRYDAFGLPTTWIPLADASLHGGSTSEEDYQYLLSIASDAASKAADATRTAFESVSAQALDDVALAGAEKKGADLIGLELSALCGKASANRAVGCLFSSGSQVVPQQLCGSTSNRGCKALNTALTQVLPTDRQVPLAAPVVAALNQALPNFKEYEGGELERLFQQQWSAWRDLLGALDAANKTVLAADAEISLADAELDAAKLACQAVQADTAAAYQDLQAAGASLAADKLEVAARQAEATEKLATAEDIQKEACSQDAADDAVNAGRTFSAQSMSPSGTYDPATGDFDWERNSDGADRKRSQSFNVGPVIAAEQRCREAERELASAELIVKKVNAALKKKLAALDAEGLSRLNRETAIERRSEEAFARSAAALARTGAAQQAMLATVASQLTVVQSYFGKLLESGANIHVAVNRANLGVKQAKLEAALASYDVKARFAVRRRFHSYDMWRARALNESARRLAVAARRSIEARFVVDLDELVTDEPFVAAPSTWANDVYRDDLRPPSSLGRTPSPAGGTGVYSDAVGDYVNNLSLFVAGYSVARPTTAARSDSEVIQLSGPASVFSVTGEPDASLCLEGESAGWSYYCEDTGQYITYPGAARFGIRGDELETACGGARPTKARLAFTLDAWGRLNGSDAAPPYDNRHNTRWARLAVNLTGVGVRDCRLAVDQELCYSEPYLHYTLRHYGPAATTGYDGSWRSLDIPTAVIENGKALAIEEWLDPVAHGWELAPVAAVARQEYAGRPLGGAYEIEIEVGPEVRLESIERVQILTLSDYWVRQEQ